MEQIFQNEGKFFNHELELKIYLDEFFFTASDFKQVFTWLFSFDEAYADLKINIHKRGLLEKKRQTYISSISKNSPFEIKLFIEQNWLSLLFLYLANYKDIKGNIQEGFKDFDAIINAIEKRFGKIFENFPELEYEIFNEELTKILTWFNTLQMTEKERFLKRIKAAQNVLKRIKFITISKRP
jgi:hypothetical protein